MSRPALPPRRAQLLYGADSSQLDAGEILITVWPAPGAPVSYLTCPRELTAEALHAALVAEDLGEGWRAEVDVITSDDSSRPWLRCDASSWSCA